ncbi:hypothetical protein Apa02nite_023240 [Actinoplanes palleronii]|uniref:Uncharacterized protein n=1 Tax=Actinoplanes palleronii TaxID=113570 RepID=A0ABQ4B6F9_9ACTN|nr:hypothetical protein Apa02nite_023240 [Actinoplanes palleronii]
MAVLFSMVLQSTEEQSSFATLERAGVRYIQALGPLEIALTNAESIAANGGAAKPEALAQAVSVVALADSGLRDQLGTQDRWEGLRAKIESLPVSGNDAAVTAAYGSANDLLLALIERVRNNSKLIRDPVADTYYLEDGAAQELPEAIIAASRYTNLLAGVPGLSAADRAKAAVDINAAGSDLAGNARDLSDDVRLAVEGSDSKDLGSALLSKLDRFNRSIDTLLPLMSPVLAGKGGVNADRTIAARDEMQVAAADLSAALLSQIDIALRDRLSSLSQRRLLAVGILVVSVLLALVPAGMALAARRRRDSRRPPQGPGPQVPEYLPVTTAAGSPAGPARAPWHEPRPQHPSDAEHSRRERFGVPQ